MKRAMCVYLPGWALQRLGRERPELRDKPVALARPRPARGPHVSACCPRAARLGVRVGMPVAEAVAIAPRLVVRADDEARDRRALGRLAVWAGRYSPIVALEEGPHAESLLLDITGCAACFGG